MSWGEWMVVTPSLQQQLELEKTVRDVTGHHDIERVRSLCASLMRQNYYYQQLIKQATGHIAQLEMQEFLSSAGQRPRLVERLLPWLHRRR
jgi:hypothetical protein